MTRDMADLSMLELFRSEAGAHAETISAGVDSLAGGVIPEKVEPLIRAASSVRGASRIVGLDSVRDIAKALETVLNNVKSDAVLGHAVIDKIKKAADFVGKLADVEVEEIDDWLEERSAVIADLLESLSSIKDAESSDRSEIEEQTDSGKSVISQDRGVASSADDLKKSEILSGSDYVTKSDSNFDADEKCLDGGSVSSSIEAHEQPAIEKEKRTPSSDLADMSMLDLFRMEAESNSQALSAGLIELEKDQSPERVEPLMRAAHSMKGAARIVGLGDAVGLAHAMEDLLVSCQNGEVVLTSCQIDLLLAATDIYSELAVTEASMIETRLVEIREKMDRLQQGLRAPADKARDYMDKASGPSLSGEVCMGSQELCELEDRAKRQESSYGDSTTETAGSSDRSGTDNYVYKNDTSELHSQQSAESDAVVRISAGSLNRLMALAGESLVESGRLEHFASSLQRIKVTLRDVMKRLDVSCERVEKGESAREVVNDIKEAGLDCRNLLSEHISEFDIYQRRLDNVSGRLYHEVISSRMRPFSDGGRGFPRFVRDIARQLGKKIDFIVEGENTPVDRDILERLESPLNHIIRNAADHGIESPAERLAFGKSETGTISMTAGHRAGMLFIEVRDDGRGMDPERIREKVVERNLAHGRMAAEMSRSELMEFLFLPGFSTAGEVTDISGRGVGLDVVHAMVQEVGGTVRAESNPGQGMVFSMQLPLTLSVIRTLLVKVAGEPYAVPLSRISRIANILPEDIELSEDRQYIRLDGSNVGLVSASRILGTGGDPVLKGGYKVVVISDRMNLYGLIVDEFLGEQDLVVRPLDSRLGKVPDVNAVSLMPDGTPVLILDAEDMVRSIDNLLSGGRLDKVRNKKKNNVLQLKILVVDDSLTVREVERKLLVNNGYTVDTAVDGMDGLNALVSTRYDLVVTDVDMPRMNGIDLVRRIKSDASLKDIPVMMVSYKDREEDRLKGLEAGADYYLTKSSFHDETLLSAVKDLIGGGK